MTEWIGLSPSAWSETRAEFVRAQAGACAICREPLTRPQLDHCHVTGFIRGALCHSCNIKLGWYEKRRREIETYLATACIFMHHGESSCISRLRD